MFRFFCAIAILIASIGAAEQSHYVLVSVAPYKNFVERIGGDTVKVGLMVPAGASSHTYEPTPKETLAASKADGWFLIGETFETKAGRAIKSYHPEIVFFNLLDGVNLIASGPHSCRCHPSCNDLHVWLSPRQAAIQAKTIAASLSSLYPEHKDLYQRNLQQLLQDLQKLDQEIGAELAPLKQRWMMVSHPAYAYFARDYDLQQLPIEFEGKDPTPRQLTQVIQAARTQGIKTIFTQIQYSNKGARLIAQLLGGKTVDLNPYAEDYFQSLREIAHQIAQSNR